MSNIVELIVKTGMDKGTQSVKELNKQYKQSNKELKEQQELVKNISNELLNMKSVKALGGIAAMVKGIKTITNGMIKATQSQTAYIENLNLLNNAYGDVTNSGQKLINQISNIVGFDQSNLTKSLGTYRQISTALGIAGNNADMLAENLLKMQTDVSSLYNLDFDVAGQKLTSAITGQSRAVKVLGADITDAGLQQTAYRLNIDKSVESMTQAEKTILRYITLDQQLKNAQGDTARTINSVATQTRIWKEQLAVLGRQIGAFLIPILQKVLPILNGILMAANAIISTALAFFGIDASKLADEFGTAEISVDGLGESLDNATSSANELKKSLRGFDKLNIITTPTSTSGGGGGVSGLNTIDNKMLDALKEYNLRLEDTKNKATEIRDKILGWLGFTTETDEKTGELSVKFDHITGGTVLGGLVVGGAIFLGIKGVIDAFTILSGLKFGKLASAATDITTISSTAKALKAMKVLASLAIIITGVTLTYNAIKGYLDKDYSWGNVLKGLGGGAAIAAGTFLLTKSVTLTLIVTAATLTAQAGVLGKQLFDEIDKSIEQNYPNDNKFVGWVKNWAAGVKLIFEDINKKLSSTKTKFNDTRDYIEKNAEFKAKLDMNTTDAVKKFNTSKTAIDKQLDFKSKLTMDTSSAAKSFNKFGTGLQSSGLGLNFCPLPTKADGGFLNTGQMFIAREAGPEMVGTIGNQTAVANNDQIVEAISIGVAKAMVSSGSKDVNITINAEGDSSGLLNFIEFKQKERNRQYGL